MKPDAWRISDPDGELATAVTLRPQNPVSETGLVIDGLYSAATIRKWLEEDPSDAMQKALNDMAQCEGYMLEGIRAMLDTKLRELEEK